MSAKVYNLSEYLEEKKSTIKLGDEVYEINDGFDTLLKIDSLASKKDEMETGEFVKEFLSLALGKENAEKLIEKNYGIKIYTRIMNCIEDSFTDDDSKEDAKSVTDMV